MLRSPEPSIMRHISKNKGVTCCPQAFLPHTSYPNPLLHDLQPHHQLDPTARVQLAGSDPKEHVEVVLLPRRLPLQLADVADVLELRLALVGVGAALATQSAEDVAGFVLAAHLDEPARGFGHEEDDAEEEKERHDLEGDGEAPDEV